MHRIKYKKPYMDKAFLYRLYIKEGLNESELADIFYTSRSTIHRWLLRFEIPLRDFSDTMKKTHWCNQTEEREERVESARKRVKKVYEDMGWEFEE